MAGSPLLIGGTAAWSVERERLTLPSRVGEMWGRTAGSIKRTRDEFADTTQLSIRLLGVDDGQGGVWAFYVFDAEIDFEARSGARALKPKL